MLSVDTFLASSSSIFLSSVIIEGFSLPSPLAFETILVMTLSLLQKPLIVCSIGKKNEQDKLESTVSNLHHMRLLWPLTHSWPSILCCQVLHSATMINTPPNTLIPPNNVIVLYFPLGNGDNEWLHKQEGLLITGTGLVSSWKSFSTNFNWLKFRVGNKCGRNTLFLQDDLISFRGLLKKYLLEILNTNTVHETAEEYCSSKDY